LEQATPIRVAPVSASSLTGWLRINRIIDVAPGVLRHSGGSRTGACGGLGRRSCMGYNGTCGSAEL